MTVSGEEHVTKPDQAIYRRLLDRFSLVPGECLFIDDNAANVAGAIQAGMAAVRFTDPATLKEYLDTLQ